MQVTNVLKDGSIKSDMGGHVVSYEDANDLYDVMRKEYKHADHERIESSGSVR